MNEEDSVVSVYRAVEETMERLAEPYEIIFVDDASTDSSVKKLKEILAHSKSLVIVALAEHSGQSEAFQAGFDSASGEIYITLDGDGQNEPKEIPLLLDKMREGYDVVCGWRFQRQDSQQKKIASKIAYFIRRLITQEKIHDVGCSLRVFRKKDVENVHLWSGLHRFFSTIMVKRGRKISEVKVTHYPRRGGVSKYGIWNRWKQGIADLFRVCFVDMDTLMNHPRSYRIKETLKAKR